MWHLKFTLCLSSRLLYFVINMCLFPLADFSSNRMLFLEALFIWTIFFLSRFLSVISIALRLICTNTIFFNWCGWVSLLKFIFIDQFRLHPFQRARRCVFFCGILRIVFVYFKRAGAYFFFVWFKWTCRCIFKFLNFVSLFKLLLSLKLDLFLFCFAFVESFDG
jgi:hypothetical protein